MNLGIRAARENEAPEHLESDLEGRLDTILENNLHETSVNYESTSAAVHTHAAVAREGAECLCAQMRKMPGLYHNDKYGGLCVAARYDDVLKVLTNPKVFSSLHYR